MTECERCSGTGFYGPKSVDQGVCFHCSGTGVVTFSQGTRESVKAPRQQVAIPDRVKPETRTYKVTCTPDEFALILSAVRDKVKEREQRGAKGENTRLFRRALRALEASAEESDE